MVRGGDTACGGTEVQMADIIRWAAKAQDSTEKAAVDPAVAGIATAGILEAVAMGEARGRQKITTNIAGWMWAWTNCSGGWRRSQQSG